MVSRSTVPTVSTCHRRAGPGGGLRWASGAPAGLAPLRRHHRAGFQQRRLIRSPAWTPMAGSWGASGGWLAVESFHESALGPPAVAHLREAGLDEPDSRSSADPQAGHSCGRRGCDGRAGNGWVPRRPCRPPWTAWARSPLPWRTHTTPAPSRSTSARSSAASSPKRIPVSMNRRGWRRRARRRRWSFRRRSQVRSFGPSSAAMTGTGASGSRAGQACGRGWRRSPPRVRPVHIARSRYCIAPVDGPPVRPGRRGRSSMDDRDGADAGVGLGLEPRDEAVHGHAVDVDGRARCAASP